MSPESKLMETWLSIFSSLRIFLCFPDDPQHTCYKKLTLVLSSGSLARTFLLLNPVSNISAGLRLFYYLPSPPQCKKTLVILTKQRRHFLHCSMEARTLFFFFFLLLLLFILGRREQGTYMKQGSLTLLLSGTSQTTIMNQRLGLKESLSGF